MVGRSLISQSLPDEEITASLPVMQSTFDRGWGDLEGVQNFQSVCSAASSGAKELMTPDHLISTLIVRALRDFRYGALLTPRSRTPCRCKLVHSLQVRSKLTRSLWYSSSRRSDSSLTSMPSCVHIPAPHTQSRKCRFICIISVGALILTGPANTRMIHV